MPTIINEAFKINNETNNLQYTRLQTSLDGIKRYLLILMDSSKLSKHYPPNMERYRITATHRPSLSDLDEISQSFARLQISIKEWDMKFNTQPFKKVQDYLDTLVKMLKQAMMCPIGPSNNNECTIEMQGIFNAFGELDLELSRSNAKIKYDILITTCKKLAKDLPEFTLTKSESPEVKADDLAVSKKSQEQNYRMF